VNIFTQLKSFVAKQPRFSYSSPTGLFMPPHWDLQEYLNAYGEIGWLFAVVSKIAEGVSEVKWRLYEGTDRDKRKQIATHPALSLLDYVNEFQTGQEFIELDSIYFDLIGESFWVFNFNRMGQPSEIWLPQPPLMHVIPDPKRFVKGYVHGFGKDATPLDIKDVIHRKKSNPRNPYRGLGAAQALGVDLAAEKYSAKWNERFFYNSARPDGVIEFEGTLSDEQFERLKQQWAERHQGVNKAHKIALLEGGGKYKQIAFNPKDMDFKNLRTMNRDSILGIYGVPLSVMGISENVNRANAEAGDHTFARWVIKPRLDRLKAKLNEQYLPKFRGTENMQIDYDEVVPRTLEQRRDLAESGVRSGYMTVNEARQMVDLDSLKKGVGDILLVPLNMIATPISGKPPPEPPEIPEIPGEPPKGGFLMPAIKMPYFQTEEQREVFWKVYAAKAEGQERLLIQTLKGLWEQQEHEAIGALRGHVNPDAPLFDIEAAKETFLERIKPILINTYRDAADDATVLIEPHPEHRSKQGEYPLRPEDILWLEERGLWLVTQVNDVTREALRLELAEGIRNGEGMEKLSRRIRRVYQDCDIRRSRVIARTETIAASNEGALVGYGASGVVESVEFYAALDERTCDECMSNHTMEFPLKMAHGIIPVHQQCRCTWIPVV